MVIQSLTVNKERPFLESLAKNQIHVKYGFQEFLQPKGEDKEGNA